MKYVCSNCGATLQEDAMFCELCGHKVELNRIPDEIIKKDFEQQEHPVRSVEENRMEDKDSVFIPVQQDKMVYDNQLKNDSGKKKEKNRIPMIIGLIFAVAILSAVLLCVATALMGGAKQKDNDSASNKDGKDTGAVYTESESHETETEYAEEITAESTEEDFLETEEHSEMILLNDTGVYNYVYPSSPDDFTEVASSDGTYTFKYPKNMFKEGYFDISSQSYHFSTADGMVTVSLTKQVVPVENDPLSCANILLNHKKSLFVQGEDRPYIHQSKAVAESGYSRSIISGQLKNEKSKGRYILHACNNQDVYVMTITYPYGGTAGTGVELSPCGYFLDCMYRGWSISGSTYELRDYDTYLNGEMGTKKAD